MRRLLARHFFRCLNGRNANEVQSLMFPVFIAVIPGCSFRCEFKKRRKHEIAPFLRDALLFEEWLDVVDKRVFASICGSRVYAIVSFRFFKSTEHDAPNTRECCLHLFESAVAFCLVRHSPTTRLFVVWESFFQGKLEIAAMEINQSFVTRVRCRRPNCAAFHVG